VEQVPSWEAERSSAIDEKFRIYETWNFITVCRRACHFPYIEAEKRGRYPPVFFIKIHFIIIIIFNIILSCKPRPQSTLCISGCPSEHFLISLLHHMQATVIVLSQVFSRIPVYSLYKQGFALGVLNKKEIK
jgi:hypothetical protein